MTNYEHLAPWSRPVNTLDDDVDAQIAENGRQARILQEAGYWKWTPEAQEFLAQALLGE